ncbi:protein fuzzy homolog isoform X2 [Papilio machaon]|uniref:protein fuzzy homolog isoform X2 n=1 Tax=Papilio machaon TaxID=76193 RepID=UPI001E66611A|nr:protein fuzzy homolog isoform X2 [Papilio machaon]
MVVYFGRNIIRGIVTGGLECDLELLLACIHDVMVFCVGKKELENLKNIDQLKRDLRQCYPILDYLLESLDPNSVPSMTLVLDLTQSILCSQAQHLQQVLDTYAERVTGRWACLSIHGHLVATSSDFYELDPRESRLLLLLAAAQDGAPLRDTLVYLPYMSPDVAFRAVTCKLLADVYVLVVCGATPALSQIDEIVLQCWEGYAQIIKEAKLVHPRNFPGSITFEPCVLGILLININRRRCVFSRHLQLSNQKGRGMSGSHRMDILRTFYVTSARDLAPELNFREILDKDSDESLGKITETYWSSEYHKCHAQRSTNLLCCVLYAPTIPTHTMRLLTSQMLQEFLTNKDIHW